MMFDFSLRDLAFPVAEKARRKGARAEKLPGRLEARAGGNEETILALLSSAGVTLLPLFRSLVPLPL